MIHNHNHILCSTSSLCPQGVTCILPVLREGVLTGSPEQKEEAAKALGGVIKLTSPEALRPSVVNITGPLIRILGDRFAWTVKTALLETLTLLLAKVCARMSVWDTNRDKCYHVHHYHIFVIWECKVTILPLTSGLHTSPRWALL